MSNIRKVLVYLLSGVTNELFLIGGALLVGIALPLNALQILYVNFFSDSFPAIAFAFEKDIDRLSARRHGEKLRLFDPLTKLLILFMGLTTSALLFGIYWFLIKTGFDENIVRTFIFASFGSYTLFLAFSVKSLDKSILQYSTLSNPYMVVSFGIGIILMSAAVYHPLLQSVFGTVALPPVWIFGVLIIAAINILAIELGKVLFRPSKSAQPA